MMRKVVIAVVLVLVVVAAGSTWVGVALRDRLLEPYQGYEGAEQFVVIAPGEGTAEIRRRFVEAGIIRDDVAFRAALWWTGRAFELQAGEYRFDLVEFANGDIH